jgi:hypothetical protein
VRCNPKGFGDSRAQMRKDVGDFKAELLKTLWITQLSAIGIILVGVGLQVHFAR